MEEGKENVIDFEEEKRKRSSTMLDTASEEDKVLRTLALLEQAKKEKVKHRNSSNQTKGKEGVESYPLFLLKKNQTKEGKKPCRNNIM